ncbi:sensor histidine kinase [Clostridium thermarum]|uniref:sensor histidine kinase n=1 Tax=Clostridium thermarum TaxID=1716543 RepID=UPI0013D22976|nr:sensor histidine kinase [Clostridium thermarum]
MHKFLLSYFALIIIPLYLLSALTYSKVSSILENYIRFSTKQAFDQTNSFLSYKMYRFQEVSDILRIDDNIIHILSKDPRNYDIHSQVKDLTYLQKYLDSFQDDVDIYRVRLYVNDEYYYSADTVNLFAYTQAVNSKWYPILKEPGRKNLWCPSSYLDDINDQNFSLLSVAASIRDPVDYSRDIGFLRIDFKKQMIDDIMQNANTVDGSFTYIQNANGVIVSASNEELISKYGIGVELTKKLSSRSASMETLNINGSECLVESNLIANTDWYMITVIPTESIFVKIRSIRKDMLFLMGIIGTIAFALAFYFSNSLNIRISKLIKAMRKVHTGNLDTFIANTSNDEIGELIDNYNYMIKRMSILIEQQYKSGKKVKAAELKALQAQINPHFLYNTLDMINWMSYKNMNKEISSAVKNLAKFYKLSLNRGKSFTSIKDELTHVSLYVEIQNMRYTNRINLLIAVEEVVYEYSIPKITLQPIVENSILHGILGRENENGKITITGRINGDDILILVQDDGIGIPEDKLATIFSENTENQKGSGYGIQNINERIKISYGEQYGLSYTSQYGKGTEVLIKIPAIKHSGT